MAVAVDPLDVMGPQPVFNDPWDAFNGGQQLSNDTSQSGLSASAPAASSSTRHTSVLDSVHSASFMFPPEDPFHAHFAARGLGGGTQGGAPLPQSHHDHRQYDGYLSVSPKTLESQALLPPLSLPLPPTAGKAARPMVYEPYPHALAPAFTPGSSISSGSTGSSFSGPDRNRLTDGRPSAASVPDASASAASASTIGDLLNQIPRGDHQYSPSGLPSIPRPPAGSALLTVKPFTRKLFDMLITPELQDLLYWDEPGRAIVICSGHPKFKSQVLHPAFGHTSVQSFHRQLNVYRFKRVDIHSLLIRTLPRCECSAWAHPDFFREGERFLYKLQPRPSKARRLKKEQQEIERRRKSLDEGGISGGQDFQESLDGSVSPQDIDFTQMPSPNMPHMTVGSYPPNPSLLPGGLVSPSQILRRPS